MELTYISEWFDHTPTTMESSTLTIGLYAGHVYRETQRGRYTWWANHNEEDAGGEFFPREIGRGRVDSEEAGKRAVEDAIRAHHANGEQQ
jgi:hypothetical protein